MSDEWKLQDTIQGLDEHGLTHMLNIRVVDPNELANVRKALSGYTQGWKPLPVKEPYSGKGKSPAKEIKSLDDVPFCGEHKDQKMFVREWELPDKPGTKIYFWNCAVKGCRYKHGERPSAENFEQYKKLTTAQPIVEQPKKAEPEPELTREQLLKKLTDMRSLIHDKYPDKLPDKSTLLCRTNDEIKTEIAAHQNIINEAKKANKK